MQEDPVGARKLRNSKIVLYSGLAFMIAVFVVWGFLGWQPGIIARTVLLVILMAWFITFISQLCSLSFHKGKQMGRWK